MIRFFALTFLLSGLSVLWTADNAISAPLAKHETAPSGVAYITGGIGEDEVRQFHEAAGKYNLRMTFATTSGSYLSDVDVVISDAAGRSILAVRTEGPFLFVKLPPGRYGVAAQLPQMAERRNVRVPPRGSVELNFHWDIPDYLGDMRLCANCPTPSKR
ncbi:carboxypeptidase regulatory-like domain-containing protein [Pandoraea anapnoica]|uniref:Carboxypeptidase regulatory-like domain-containing protein n=1 Tax=Pandoraea anapnoica TaxID=2508301 RepID=A0A5E4ZZ24_9BURK|nr:carboxypeptidase-like regulatory domain-containing protein [Pandoraea anapnoica]VVE65200.1 carboxypeptidase regulatory-like domain-containing protein [Pandoraea anapnoica]